MRQYAPRVRICTNNDLYRPAASQRKDAPQFAVGYSHTASLPPQPTTSCDCLFQANMHEVKSRDRMEWISGTHFGFVPCGRAGAGAAPTIQSACRAKDGSESRSSATRGRGRRDVFVPMRLAFLRTWTTARLRPRKSPCASSPLSSSAEA